MKNTIKTDMRGKHGNHIKSDQHHRWNSGQIITQKGYVKVRVGSSHPLADSNGYVMEHMLIWVSAGNPLSDKDHVIHHKNKCKTDNRIENLQIVTRQEHERIHGRLTLTDQEVRDILDLYAGGMRQADIATRFNTNRKLVWKIVHRLKRRRATT
jgi:hypothetical protein